MNRILIFKSVIMALMMCVVSSVTHSTEHQEVSIEGQSKSSKGFSWDVTIAIDASQSQFLMIGEEESNKNEFLGFSFLVDLYYKGFFIQSNKHRLGGYLSGGELGYELLVTEEYEIDLISKSYIAGFSSQNDSIFNNKGNPELIGVKERDYISNLGIRYMRYMPDAVYWVDIASNLIGTQHSGWVIDGFYSHMLQHKNWDINLGVGASIFSRDMNNYFFSVSPEESNEQRPIYNAGAGYRLQFEAFAQRPISDSWLFSSGIIFSHYSNSIYDSPLVARQNILRAQVGVRYVF